MFFLGPGQGAVDEAHTDTRTRVDVKHSSNRCFVHCYHYYYYCYCCCCCYYYYYYYYCTYSTRLDFYE